MTNKKLNRFKRVNRKYEYDVQKHRIFLQTLLINIDLLGISVYNNNV